MERLEHKTMTRLDYEKCRNEMVSLIMKQDYHPANQVQLKALCDYAYSIGYSAGYAEGHSDASNGLDKRQVAHTNGVHGEN
jgi:hypothetical protein